MISTTEERRVDLGGHLQTLSPIILTFLPLFNLLFPFSSNESLPQCSALPRYASVIMERQKCGSIISAQSRTLVILKFVAVCVTNLASILQTDFPESLQAYIFKMNAGTALDPSHSNQSPLKTLSSEKRLFLSVQCVHV
jgi:hypothetical protein